MFVSVDERAPCPQPLTVSANNPSSKSSNALVHEKSVDIRLEDGRQNPAHLIPTSANASSSFDIDLEDMKPTQSLEHSGDVHALGNRFNSDNSVWPGQAHWKKKALAAERKNRSCRCLAQLSKQSRIAVKLAIALVVVGVAIGVGFGISKSLGARIWQPKDDQR
ncbi:hypothetical protein F4777DRAFT_584201 [Nemania sp. FL0916]|nr:hypothetical protein F4777DRAFT_584201 [Nemania sp. FL0916]